MTGSVATKGGTAGNGCNKFKPAAPIGAPGITSWNELEWPVEFPLAYHEMSILLPHFLNEGRGALDVYFSRVYNPIWTNPDGFTWMEALRDEDKVKCHVALTPTWSETSWFADYVLPMGVSTERHDVHSYETHAGRWIGFRQPTLRRYAEIRSGERSGPRRPQLRLQPRRGVGGERVLDRPQLAHRPGRRAGNPAMVRIRAAPGHAAHRRRVLRRDVRGERARPRRSGHRRRPDAAGVHARPLRVRGTDRPVRTVRAAGRTRRARRDCTVDADGVYRKAGTPGAWDGDLATLDDLSLAPLGDGSPAVDVDGEAKEGFPTPSKKLELYSTTLADWGWPEYATPTWIPSHVHWEDLDLAGDERILLPTFRIPTLIHTRSANSKWLNEISHRHPLWIHPEDAEKLDIAEEGLVRVTTRIGHFVIAAWRTEGIRPGVVAASHHMGRWRLEEDQARSWGAGKAAITSRPGDDGGTVWKLSREHGNEPYDSTEPDTSRIWWNDTGVHQNATFCVQPDPISGMQCWHQRVRVGPARPGDEYGDVVVDTAKSREAYLEWLAKTRPAGTNDTGLRRPLWYARPLKPTPAAYRLP